MEKGLSRSAIMGIASVIGIAIIVWSFLQVDVAKKAEETAIPDFYTFIVIMVVLFIVICLLSFSNLLRNSEK